MRGFERGLVLDFRKSIGRALGAADGWRCVYRPGLMMSPGEAEAELGIAHSPDVVSGVLRCFFFCAGAQVRDRSELGMNDLLSFFLFLRFGVGVFDG